jgi:uncharacterized membrane protein YvbJ
MSTAPDYRWICHACRSPNEAGSASCTSCGFPAVASAKDIDEAKGEPTSSRINTPQSFALKAIIITPCAILLKIITVHTLSSLDFAFASICLVAWVYLSFFA